MKKAKNCQQLITIIKIFFIGLIFSTNAYGEMDYKPLADDISQRFDKAYTAYQNKDYDEAKELVSAAYFEVFESLEGPIRVNVSAKKSAQMESVFVDLRRMVINKVPIEELKASMDGLKKEIYEVLPELTEFKLVAESVHEEHPDTQTSPPKDTEAKKTEPIKQWLDVLAYIKNNFDEALIAFGKGDIATAKKLIKDARFVGYRNMNMERAIRNYVSNQKEQEYQFRFTKINDLLDENPKKAQLEISLEGLYDSLYEVSLELGEIYNQLDPKSKPKAQEENLPRVDYNKVVQDVKSEFNKAFDLYKQGNAKKAISKIQDTYFDVFEASGMENAIGAKNSSLKLELEGYFTKIIAHLKKGSSQEIIDKEFASMKNKLQEGVELLSVDSGGFWTMFIWSLTIILREGFEALLIVTAIIAYLVKSGNSNRLGIVYSSVTIAIILSFVTAWIMNLIFGSTAAEYREILEGGVMIIASILLIYVSYWLLSNATSNQWASYIKNQVSQSLDTKSTNTLWWTSFLAVYREGAETVLFYQALIADVVDDTGYIALISGFVLGALILIVVYFIMKYTAIKLPIKPFFIVTGVFIYVMAFVFVGKGIMEFVEGKVFQPTLLDWGFTVKALGINPYYETMLPQGIILLVGIWGLYLLFKKYSKKENT